MCKQHWVVFFEIPIRCLFHFFIAEISTKLCLLNELTVNTGGELNYTVKALYMKHSVTHNHQKISIVMFCVKKFKRVKTIKTIITNYSFCFFFFFLFFSSLQVVLLSIVLRILSFFLLSKNYLPTTVVFSFLFMYAL